MPFWFSAGICLTILLFKFLQITIPNFILYRSQLKHNLICLQKKKYISQRHQFVLCFPKPLSGVRTTKAMQYASIHTKVLDGCSSTRVYSLNVKMQIFVQFCPHCATLWKNLSKNEQTKLFVVKYLSMFYASKVLLKQLLPPKTCKFYYTIHIAKHATFTNKETYWSTPFNAFCHSVHCYVRIRTP